MASVAAAALRIPLLGAGPIFVVTPHAALGGVGLLTALVVGLVAGAASGGLTWMVYASEDLFPMVPLHWMWWPAIGGLVVGIGGLIEPRTLGIGFDVIRDLLNGQIVGAAVAAILITKALIWSISLGSGTSGGVLAPLLFMGGALGALAAPFAPVGTPGEWALISMAAMLGGTMRSPLTAVVFLLEVTHDFNLLTGLLVACMAAHAVTVVFLRRSILTEKVARRGHHVMREYSVSPFARIRVIDVMTTNVPTVPATLQINAFFRRILHDDSVFGRAQAWPIVGDNGALEGLLTRSDVVRTLDEGSAGDEPSALDAGNRTPVVAYPDELLEEAMDKAVEGGPGFLPVVDHADPTHLVGMLDTTAMAAVWRVVSEEERA
jgi:CBS domain-containing protein